MKQQERTAFIDHYRQVAHRGLHDRELGIPENSLPAFARAVEQGKAIELDLHATADNRLVVLHDFQLKRMTGVPGIVEEWTLEDLRKLRLQGTDAQIPTLDEVLELVNGRVPLLLEIKSERLGEVGRLEPVLMKRLASYQGEFILEAFNPEVLVWLHRHAPQYIRGQLGNLDDENRQFKFYSRHLMFNPLSRPDFIAFDIQKIDYKLRLACKKHGLPLLGWTIRTEAELKKADRLCDGVIYEHLEL